MFKNMRFPSKRCTLDTANLADKDGGVRAGRHGEDGCLVLVHFDWSTLHRFVFYDFFMWLS